MLGSFAVTKRQLPGFSLCAAGHTTITSTQASPIASVTEFRLGRLLASTAICEKKFDGIRPVSRPRKSRTCDSAMMIAMPVVKPTTMETGTNRTRVPIRIAPKAKSSAPAIIVAMSRFAIPYLSAMP